MGAYSLFIVEDENIVAMNLRRQLEDLGYTVLGASRTGEEAIERADACRPDLVLMDISLAGDLDGIQAAEILRDRFDIPVIFLTAYSDDATLERAKAVEPYGYILKPISSEELRVVTEVAVHRHHAQQLLRLHARQQAALAEFGQYALALRSVEDIAAAGVRLICEVLAADSAAIFLDDADGRYRVLAGQGWTQGEVLSATELLWWGSTAIPLAGKILADLPTEGAACWGAALHQRGIISGCVATVGDGSGLRGLVGAFSGAPGLCATENAAWLQTMTNAFSLALQRQNYVARLESVQEDLKAANAALRARGEARFRDLAEAMPQIVWTAQADGTVDYHNKRWEATGLRRTQSTGSGWEQAVHPLDRERTRTAWKQAVESGGIYELEHRIARSGGGWCWMLSRAIPIHDEDGALIAWYGTSTDIDEVKGIQEELRDSRDELLQQREELRQANADLEQFAYVASHDLQEPLRGVSLKIDLLQSLLPREDPQLLQLMDHIRDGARRMRELIRGVMFYTSMGQIGDMLHERCDSAAALAIACHNLGQMIEDSGAEIEVGDLPVVAAPQDVLAQVFQNLLSNAIKFRGKTSPWIRLEARIEGPFWHFVIRDNGIGIDSKQADRIFSMFQRLHGREVPGTGVGLPIARRIVERLGGHMWFQPAEVGSTFHFTLPVVPCQEPERLVETLGRPGPR